MSEWTKFVPRRESPTNDGSKGEPQRNTRRPDRYTFFSLFFPFLYAFSPRIAGAPTLKKQRERIKTNWDVQWFSAFNCETRFNERGLLQVLQHVLAHLVQVADFRRLGPPLSPLYLIRILRHTHSYCTKLMLLQFTVLLIFKVTGYFLLHMGASVTDRGQDHR